MMPWTPTLALGQQYHRAGDFQRAEQVYRQLLQTGPASADLLFYLGSACQSQGKQAEAAVCLRQALQDKPDYPEAMQNLGVLLAEQGHTAEAVDLFRRAAQHRPGWLEPLIDLGNLFQSQGQLDEALRCFQQTLGIQDCADHHNRIGIVLALRGEIQAAASHFKEALRQEPRYAVAHSNLLLTLSHDPDLSPASLLTEHRWWDCLHGQGMALHSLFVNRPDPERRLRIGYVSPDLRQSALAPFIEPVLREHDSACVETFAYAELTRQDPVTRRLQANVHGWRFVANQSDAAIADQIREDGIDILVDLAGHTANNRLGVFARKPAPVQVTYLGYAGTTGLATIDYRLTDATADPAGEPSGHSEKLYRLPGCFCCYAPPAESPSMVTGSSIEQQPITFGAPHKLLKLNDGVLNLWGRVLRAVPSARLLICRNTLSDKTCDYWQQRLENQGIPANQLEIRQAVKSEASYLQVYQEMDILLDVFPWTGHATTCEALWMGVPVVTLSGNRFAGRMSASVLTALGLTELIASHPDEYVDIAARLAQDRCRLKRLRLELRERMRASPLCDARKFMLGLEDAYRWMWRRWCQLQA
jgi:predicted O-linked N-acetylglucosamine transferase (SPINDLY family)